MILSELKADGKWQWLLMQAFLMIMNFSSRWKASNLLSRSGEKQVATPTAITDLKSIYGDVTKLVLVLLFTRARALQLHIEH